MSVTEDVTKKVLESTNSLAGKLVNATSQQLKSNSESAEHKVHKVLSALDADIQAQELKNTAEKNSIIEIEKKNNETEALLNSIKEKQQLNETVHNQEPVDLKAARESAEKKAEQLKHEFDAFIAAHQKYFSAETFVAVESNNTVEAGKNHTEAEASLAGETSTVAAHG